MKQLVVFLLALFFFNCGSTEINEVRLNLQTPEIPLVFQTGKTKITKNLNLIQNKTDAIVKDCVDSQGNLGILIFVSNNTVPVTGEKDNAWFENDRLDEYLLFLNHSFKKYGNVQYATYTFDEPTTEEPYLSVHKIQSIVLNEVKVDKVKLNTNRSLVEKLVNKSEKIKAN